jgi:hypothetical protein
MHILPNKHLFTHLRLIATELKKGKEYKLREKSEFLMKNKIKIKKKISMKNLDELQKSFPNNCRNIL